MSGIIVRGPGDKRWGDYPDDTGEQGWVVELPHHCDEWPIASACTRGEAIKELDSFIDDLIQARIELASKPLPEARVIDGKLYLCKHQHLSKAELDEHQRKMKEEAEHNKERLAAETRERYESMNPFQRVNFQEDHVIVFGERYNPEAR